MTTLKSASHVEPKPVGGGCCATHGAVEPATKALERTAQDRHLDHVKAEAADAPADKPKAKHGSGCCCS